VLSRLKFEKRPLFAILLWSTLFTLAYAQAPLYTSNQNQYFLHGLADAGVGHLNEDWLANTRDPTPVFSALVFLTHRILSWDAYFYLYFGILAGIYLHSLLGIGASIFNLNQSPSDRRIFLAVLIGLNSAAARFVISNALGEEWNYLFDGGVAGQRLLGSVLQPSTFGVLLLLSIHFFLRNRHAGAVVCVILAASIHPTYLLSGGILTVIYMGLIFREERHLRRPLAIGYGALLGVAPILIHTYTVFKPTSAELTMRSREILVADRIPHHAIPEVWFDATVMLKAAFMLAALILLFRKWKATDEISSQRLFHILLWPFLLASALTCIQVSTKSGALALLFPWRVSTFIVPLAVAVITARLASDLHLHRALLPLSLVLVLALSAAGFAKSRTNYREKLSDQARPMMLFVQETKSAGETYLIPPKMQDFRLVTGAPIYVDFKAIPYKDSEFMEWHRREQLAARFYRAANRYAACPLLDQLHTEEELTHAVLPSDHPGRGCPGVRESHQDEHFGVYALMTP
jgi:hypothetical protein